MLTLRNFPPFPEQDCVCDEQCLRSLTALITSPTQVECQPGGQGQEQRASQQWKGGRTAAARRRPSARSWDKGWAFSASAEGNARGPSGSKPHGGGGASEGKCRPDAILLASLSLCHSYGRGEEPFRVEEMSSKRRSPMRVVGQRGK